MALEKPPGRGSVTTPRTLFELLLKDGTFPCCLGICVKLL